jgi:hypothetical protein
MAFAYFLPGATHDASPVRASRESAAGWKKRLADCECALCKLETIREYCVDMTVRYSRDTAVRHGFLAHSVMLRVSVLKVPPK